MKISTLTLRNFRRHEESAFDLAPVTLFTGPNGSGKSSVAEALRLALSGKTEALNDRNEGIGDLVRRGQKQAEIVVDLPEGDSIVRRIPGGLSITGTASTTNQKAAETALALLMGGRPDQARLAMGPRLWKLDDKSRRDTLGDVLRLYYSADDVRAALEEQGEVAGHSLLELARQVAGSVTNDLAGMEERAREARRICKKDLERAEHRRADLHKRVGEGDDQVSQIQPPSATALQQARLRVSTLFGSRRQLEMAQGEVQKARARLEALESELDGRTAEPEEVCQEGRNRLQARRLELAQSEERLRKLDQARASVRVLQDSLRQIEANCEAARRSCCPTCGSPTRQDPARIQELEEGRRVVLERLRASQAAASGQESEEEVRILRRYVGLGEAWVEEQNRLRWLAGTIQEARVRLQEATERLAGMEAPEPSAQAEAERHLEQLEQQATWAREWQVWLTQLKQANQEVEDLTRRRDALDRLCGWLGPNGYRHQVLQSRIEPLVHEVNGILSAWGMEVDYEVGTLGLVVTTPRTSEPVPYHLLSDGEQILVQAAHQAFLATVCGVRILVLDRVEALDKRAQQQLFRACFDLTGPQGPLDHVLLMAVDTANVTFPTGVPTDAFRRYALSTNKTERRTA